MSAKYSIYNLIRPLLFTLEPENAHRLTFNTLKQAHKLGLTKLFKSTPDCARKVMGLEFPNPVGLAAGLDKNAECIDPLGSLGFGFIEVGSVTPHPQTGNPKPRLFRLQDRRALINRMGFNNKGLDYFVERLKERTYRGILGVSITQNNNSPFEKAIEDYRTCFTHVYPYASYISVDVSCPNVEGQKSLHLGEPLEILVKTLKAEQERLQQQYQKYTPMAVKISPDLSAEEIKQTAEILLKNNIDGVIATNTTRTRPGLADVAKAQERGGLSGEPLFKLAQATVCQLHNHLQNRIPIIAVGGIMSGDDAIKMFNSGASLVQIYTGLIYKGPALIQEIITRLMKEISLGE